MTNLVTVFATVEYIILSLVIINARQVRLNVSAY